MPDQNPQPNIPEQSAENIQDNIDGKESVSPEIENISLPKKPEEAGGGEIPSQTQAPASQSPVRSAVPASDSNAKPSSVPDQIVDDETDAKDVDIIEKPWVKKAEDIIKKDKGKPYFEEEDHEDLQIDYLKKRFGKDIKKSD